VTGPYSGPARRPVQLSDWTYEQLDALARAWQADERLPRRPTFDDVVRRLLESRNRLAEILAAQAGQP